MTHDQSVFIIDDDLADREAIAALVDTLGVHRELFCCVEDFLAGYADGAGGCVVAELRMPGMSGVDLLENLSLKCPRLPVIFLTAFADIRTTVSVMKAGATTLMEKPHQPGELAATIVSALAQDRRAREDAARLNAARAGLRSLSADEKRVLDLIVAGDTNKGIAHSLRFGLRTVEARRQVIMQKLGVRSLAEMVRIVAETELLDARPGFALREAAVIRGENAQPLLR